LFIKKIPISKAFT